MPKIDNLSNLTGLLVIGGLAVGAIAIATQAKAAPKPNGGPDPDPDPDPNGNGGDEPEPEPFPIPGPDTPMIKGGEVVLQGFRSNPFGIQVVFRVEFLDEDEQAAKGGFYGLIFKPWELNNPAVVTQKPTKEAARDEVFKFIDGDQHGAPPFD